MAIAFVQALGTNQSKTSGTSLVISVASLTVTSGNTIFVAFGSDPGLLSGLGATDNLGNTYSLVKQQVNGTLTSGVLAGLLSAPVTSAGTLTSITVSWTNAVTAKAAAAGEYSGVGTLNSTDGVNGTSAASASGTSSNPGATIATGELAILAGAQEGTATISGTASGSSAQTSVVRGQDGTSGSSGASNIRVALGDIIATSSDSFDNLTPNDQFRIVWSGGTNAAGAAGYYAVATSGATGTLATTLDDSTAAFSGAAGASGTEATTLDAAVLAGSGAAGAVGTEATTLADATLAGTGGQFSAYPSAVLVDIPLIYWRLGESSGTNAVDISGGAHDGTYANTPTLGVTGAISGDSDTAVTFTAASSEDVRVASFSALNITTFTLECWVNTTGANQAILGRQGGTSVPYSMFVDASGFLQIVIKTSGTAGTNYSDTSGTVINDGLWHHVAIVRDAATSNTVYFYIDGVQKSSVASTVVPNTSTSVGFAAASRGTTPFLNGSIDEAALYASALSSTRIAAHYAAAAGSGATGTLATTLSDSTLAATGEQDFAGTLSTTLDDSTLVGAAAETLAGSLASTLDDSALAATGEQTFTGTLSTALDDGVLAAAGVEEFAGTLAATLDDSGASIAGTVANPITGTLAASLDDSALTAAVTETISGTIASTLDDGAITGTGVESFAGTLAASLGDAALAGTASETFSGTLATQLDDGVLAATGSETVTGTLATTLDDAALAATGTAGTPPVTGTLAASLADATMSGAGEEDIAGTFTVTLDGATLDATGSETFAGQLATTLDGATLAAVGVEAVSGTIAITLDDATASGGGTETEGGQLAAVLDGATLDATGTVSGGISRDIIVSVTLEPSGRAAVLVASPYGADILTGSYAARLNADPRTADVEPADKTARVEAT